MKEGCLRNLPQFKDHKSIIKPRFEKKDKLLSYPYESMRPFLNLLREAAEDEDVVSIKMTLYRVAKQSQIAAALIEAADNGQRSHDFDGVKSSF